jgi:hypothetical protein
MDGKQAILDYFRNDYTPFFLQFFPDLTPSKDEARVLCPFHDDTNPSMDIILRGEKAGAFICRACNAQGYAFEFWARKHSLDCQTEFPAVIKGIAEAFQISLPNGNGRTAVITNQKKHVRTLAERGISQETANAFQITEGPGDSTVSNRITFPVKSPNGTTLGLKVHKAPALKADGKRAGPGEAAPAQIYPWKGLEHHTINYVNGEPSV